MGWFASFAGATSGGISMKRGGIKKSIKRYLSDLAALLAIFLLLRVRERLSVNFSTNKCDQQQAANKTHRQSQRNDHTTTPPLPRLKRNVKCRRKDGLKWLLPPYTFEIDMLNSSWLRYISLRK